MSTPYGLESKSNAFLHLGTLDPEEERAMLLRNFVKLSADEA
jgi:hypothetical protein